MKIRTLVERSTDQIILTEDPSFIAEKLCEMPFLVLGTEDDPALTVISEKDLKSNSRTVSQIALAHNKPHVSPEESVTDVYEVMRTEDTDCLLVFENDAFMGVIYLPKVMDSLVELFKERQFLFQKVIHDLRNPIDNLRNLINLLLQMSDDTDVIEVLQMGQKSAEQALEILTDLLYIECEENKPLHKEDTDINFFYEQCIMELKSVGDKKKINFELSLCSEPVIRSIDRLRFKRAIQNLISNAIKFSFPNSTIVFSSKFDNQNLILEVSDTGIGIPESYRKDVFKQFTSSGRPGTLGEPSIGLGLFFTKMCVEQHNGKIYFDTETGKGTTFYIAM